MSGSTIISPAAARLVASPDPYLIEIIAPIESATMAATLSAIRGPVPASRATLAGLSDALDAQAEDLARLAKRVAKRAALIFGSGI